MKTKFSQTIEPTLDLSIQLTNERCRELGMTWLIRKTNPKFKVSRKTLRKLAGLE